ncbi:MAG: S8 family serine peptidase [Anaerovoracaceae bacterium]|jgi:subtilisin family serine protease
MNKLKSKILAVVTSAVMLVAFTPAALPYAHAETAASSESQTSVISEQPSVSELTKGKEYSDDEVLVLFDDSTSKSEVKQETKEEGYSAETVTTQLDGSKLATVSTDNVKEALKDMQNADGAVYVQPNYTYTVDDTTKDPYCTQEAKKCWQLGKVNAESAWSYMDTNGYEQGVKVCVIDTGCQTDHEDLTIDTALSRTFVNGTSSEFKGELSAGSDHGTHVCGIINMTYNNQLGGAGIAAGTNNDVIDLFVCGVSEDGENMYDADIINAVNYAAQSGAKVINMSFGGDASEDDGLLASAIKQAYSNYDIVFCAANGNIVYYEDAYIVDSPAYLSYVLAVGSTNINNKHSSFSKYNKYIDVAAPGEDVLSTYYTGGSTSSYISMSGTSMATPCATAVAALVRSANPDLKNYQVMDIVESTATDLGTSGWDIYFGSGLINAYKAVKSAYVEPVSDVSIALTGYRTIKISWTGTSDATSYSVQYRKYGGTFHSVDSNVESGTTTCTAKNLSLGTKYQFRVIARDANGNSAPVYSSWMYTMNKGKVKSVKKYSTYYVKVYWASVPNATQYQIYVCKSKSSTGNVYKKVTVNRPATSLRMKMKRNVTYYYRVRAIRKSGSKTIYAPISNPVAFKLK